MFSFSSFALSPEELERRRLALLAAKSQVQTDAPTPAPVPVSVVEREGDSDSESESVGEDGGLEGLLGMYGDSDEEVEREVEEVECDVGPQRPSMQDMAMYPTMYAYPSMPDPMSTHVMRGRESDSDNENDGESDGERETVIGPSSRVSVKRPRDSDEHYDHSSEREGHYVSDHTTVPPQSTTGITVLPALLPSHPISRMVNSAPSVSTAASTMSSTYSGPIADRAYAASSEPMYTTAAAPTVHVDIEEVSPAPQVVPSGPKVVAKPSAALTALVPTVLKKKMKFTPAPPSSLPPPSATVSVKPVVTSDSLEDEYLQFMNEIEGL